MENKTMKDWVVVLWSFGYHCDEFDVEGAVGPFSREKAEEFRLNYEGSYHLEIVELTKGE